MLTDWKQELTRCDAQRERRKDLLLRIVEAAIIMAGVLYLLKVNAL